MVKASLQFTLIFLLLVLLLTFEAVVGLPIIFFVAFGLISSVFTSLLWWPVLLILLLSFVLAILYQLPIVVAFILLIFLAILNFKGESFIARKSVRLIIGAVIGAVVMIVVSPILLVEIGLFTLLVQSCIVMLLIWRTVGVPIKRWYITR